MTDSPWQEDGAFTASFKAGKGYEEPWLVVRGNTATALRDRIVEAFGLEGDFTLIEAIHNANQLFHALTNVGRELGGRVIRGSSAQEKAATAGNDPWIAAQAAATEEQPPADPNKKLLDEIEAATTVDQLKRFWVTNNPLNEVVEAAWRAKGKSLQEGGN
ncbi:hypothetical protein ACFOOK_26180 [Micromonospora krabiensis]|uniref:Uncharacterized protein n=1 Tax=Micromonospora krabiensis TaxID=307121 RepID=A0A1C3N5X7_9ACTN|nr:hypothetical protein [Micromonospora krabiensis]SBV27946.1 hypothetical protein GA0070620_3477 [Micromonospora krabiensis]